MTATATAVAGRRVATDHPAGALPLVPLAEVALAAVSLAGVYGLRPVFLDIDWFWPLALQVLLAHGVAAALRRRGTALVPAALATAVLGAVVIAWLYAGELTTFGLPGGAVFDSLSTQVGDALGAWSEVKAPTEALDGFLIATSVAIWVGAVLGDWAAFRVDAPLEATLPSATLFVLGAVLGADVHRAVLTGVWLAAALAFVLFRRADRLGQSSTWVGDRRSAGPRALVAVGVGLSLVAVALAALLGPRLPGAETEGVVSLQDLGGNDPGTRVTVSPLVDIRSRLFEQAAVEVFSVRSPVRSYWRLTSLDRFDGQIWSSSGSYGKANGSLEDGVPVASREVGFEQSFAIAALSQIWLPAAYQPTAVDAPQDVRWDEVSGTLIVDTDVPTADNLAYEVTSELPQHDPAQLAAASTQIPDDIRERYLSLPADFPESIRNKAREVVAGATSVYDASLRLQNFFREFEYDLDVGKGHSEQAMEHFVLELRRGYCEQFAGSYAAMARSVGIPARVAVGFTPGVTDPADPNVYRVRGEHAHAWPEIYLGEYGWVAFEPTPGRGAPFAEQYTGVPEQQAASGSGTAPPTTSATPPSTQAPGPATTAVPGLGLPEEDIGGGDVDLEADEGRDRWKTWLDRLAVAAGVVVVIVALYLLAVLALTAWHRHRRRSAATDADAQVALAWEESLASIRRAGVPVRPALTQTEVTARVGSRLSTLEPQIRSLATAVERVTYSPDRAAPEDGVQALALADEIASAAGATMSGAERFRGRFHPRRLLGQ